MGSSREESPDWLRCFQPPSSSTLVLSSDSEPSGDGSPSKDDKPDYQDLSLSNSPKISTDDENLGKILGGDDSKSQSVKKSRLKSPKKGLKLEDEVSPGKNKSVNRKKRKLLNSPVLMLSSDSELSVEKAHDPETSQQIGEAEDKIHMDSDDETLAKRASRDRAPKNEPDPETKEMKKEDLKQEGSDCNVEATEEGAPGKPVGSHASSARLPLVLSEKVHRTKALVECEGDSIDLGGDMGSVGRVVISDNLSGDKDMYLDLKGTIYKTTIVPSRTFCVVSFGQSEAKVEAIMNDFIQLKPQSNVFEAETMVEGTLDGFSFDSDEEEKVLKGASHKTDDNEDAEAKPNGKRKAKSEKTSGVAKKRGKSAGAKSQPQKKGKKKTQAPKKTKAKK